MGLRGERQGLFPFFNAPHAIYDAPAAEGINSGYGLSSVRWLAAFSLHSSVLTVTQPPGVRGQREKSLLWCCADHGYWGGLTRKVARGSTSEA
ncbi:hypothetical protein GCM10010246_55840 [Streptomyces cuspidosporus]|uniref:Uncharacterized protein n=1 Tax=Streptomyces cuspidosporus TaxID=66882 RepID=A0ABN3GR92_9ACTN